MEANECPDTRCQKLTNKAAKKLARHAEREVQLDPKPISLFGYHFGKKEQEHYEHIREGVEQRLGQLVLLEHIVPPQGTDYVLDTVLLRLDQTE